MNRRRLFSICALLCLVLARNAFSQDTNHNFAKWEREITAFEQQDKTNLPPKDSLLFTGSSTIRLWKTLAQDFPNHQVVNRGFGGCEIVDVTHFADRIIFPYRPKMIFLRCGGNDLYGGKSAEQVFADYQEFVRVVQAKLSETEIVFIGLSPSIARWSQHEKERELNELATKYSESRTHLKYIEDYDIVLGPDGKPRPELFVSDKLHFSAEGYKLLVESVRPFLPKN
jgi:hypothetical protein